MPRTAALRRRLMRLRSTAPPTCLLTVKPNLRRFGQRRRVASLALQNECGRRPTGARAHAQELGPALERGKPRARPGPRAGGRLRSGFDRGLGHASRRPRLTPTGACAPWRGGVPGCGGPRRSPYACEIHDGACGRAGSVDRCASRLLSRVEALSLHALGNRPDRCHAGTPRWCGSAAEPARIAGRLYGAGAPQVNPSRS